MSPRQDSVCSDSEVPYVSYTISKPIGDSPKKGSKPQQTSKYKFSNPMLSQRSASTASSLASTGTKPNYFGRRQGIFFSYGSNFKAPPWLKFRLFDQKI